MENPEESTGRRPFTILILFHEGPGKQVEQGEAACTAERRIYSWTSFC
jgi:hypothetical protein